MWILAVDITNYNMCCCKINETIQDKILIQLFADKSSGSLLPTGKWVVAQDRWPITAHGELFILAKLVMAPHNGITPTMDENIHPLYIYHQNLINSTSIGYHNYSNSFADNTIALNYIILKDCLMLKGWLH